MVVLMLIGTRAVLITKVSSGVNIFIRWVFNFCLFLDFSYGISVLNVKFWGGELSMTDLTFSNTNKGYICFWIGFWSLVSGF